MAGDWIKLQHATPDKPEVMKIAKVLGMQPEQVVGHLVRVWSWADQQSLDGHALDVTEIDVDRVARHAGVAQAMREVGWLKGQDGRISFPNFDRHNGESAKKRALAADRKRVERSRSSRDGSVTREEERREESNSMLGASHLASVSPQSSPPESQKQKDRTSLNRGVRLAKALRIEEGYEGTAQLMYDAGPVAWLMWGEQERPELAPIQATWMRFCDHWRAQAGQRGVKADWEATWRNWVRKEAAPRGNGAGKQTALEARNSQVAANWTPPEDRTPELPGVTAVVADGDPMPSLRDGEPY